MILTPESNLESAHVMAGKIRHVIAAPRFDTTGTVTASFDVTEFQAADDPSSMLKKADDALCKAKANGRNRVETLRTKTIDGLAAPGSKLLRNQPILGYSLKVLCSGDQNTCGLIRCYFA